MRLFFQIVWEAILDILYPPFCCGCGRIGTYLCPNCYQTINFIPLPLVLELEPNYIDSVYVTAHYEGVLKKLIKTYKYKSVKDIGKVISSLIWYSTTLPKVDLISYIPLNKKKLNQRGFNQTEIIAKELALLMKVPFINTLSKIGKHGAQASMNTKEERLNNLKGTFIISTQFKNYLQNEEINTDTKNEKQKETNQNKNNKIESILLIDDVITTGTTLNEASKVLKEFGIKTIYGLTIAHGH